MKTHCYLILDAHGVVGMRKTPPDLRGGEVAIRTDIEVSDKFFQQFIPRATLEIGDDQIIEADLYTTLRGLEDESLSEADRIVKLIVREREEFEQSR